MRAITSQLENTDKMRNLIFILLISIGAFAQNNPDKFRNGVDTPLIRVLDKYTNAELDALTDKEEGDKRYSSTDSEWKVYDGANWVSFGSGGGSSFDETADYTPSGFWNFTGNMQSTGNVDFLGTFEWHNNSFRATMPNLTQNDTIATQSYVLANSGDFSEWASYSGIRAAGNLLTTIGDYDDSGNGNKIIIDDAENSITIGGQNSNTFNSGGLEVRGNLYNYGFVQQRSLGDSLYIIFQKPLLSGNRSVQWQDKDGTVAYLNDVTSSSLLTPINATNNRTFLADDHEGMKVFRNIGNGEVNLSIPLDATLDYPDNSFFVFKTPFIADITKVSFPQFDGTSTVTKTVQSLGTKDGESFNVVKIGNDNWYAEGDFKYFDPIDLSSLYINMTPSSIDATATAEDDAIATWTDLQNGYNATSATNQPQVNIVNGERHVEFVSANSDFLAIPHANTNFVPGTDEFTILIKIGANYTTQDQYLYGKSLINTSTIQYGLWILNNDFRIYIGGTNLGYASADVAAGDILTLVVRNNGADFYKNDTLIYDNVGIGTATNTEDLIIGASYQGASNNADASFTDFKVWNEALTSAQVLDIVNTLN